MYHPVDHKNRKGMSVKSTKSLNFNRSLSQYPDWDLQLLIYIHAIIGGKTRLKPTTPKKRLLRRAAQDIEVICFILHFIRRHVRRNLSTTNGKLVICVNL